MKYKNVFIFVIGSTPQIITETIWAAKRLETPLSPDEIKIITTLEGKRRIVDSFFNGNILNSFVRDEGIKNLPFDERDIIVLSNNYVELEDVRTYGDNKLVAEKIIDLVYNYTKEKDSRLIASLAGGRKTMGYYLGFAMSLFGRPQDRLFHVLVSPAEFESNRDFFYKPKKNIILPNGLNTKDARIELIDLPFVRLRSLVDLKNLKVESVIKTLQEKIEILSKPLDLKIILNKKEKDFGKIVIGDIKITLPSHLLAFYLTFIDKKLNCKKQRRTCTDCYECFMSMKDELLSREFADVYTKYYSKIEDKFKAERSIFYTAFNKNMSSSTEPDAEIISNIEQKIRENISEINKELRGALISNVFTDQYVISKVGRYGNSRYGIYLSKDRIKIIG